MVVRVDPGPWKVTAARPAYYFMGEWRLKMFVDPTENADNWYGRINCRVVDGKDVVGTGWTNWSVAPAIIDLRITTARRGDHIECEAGQ